MWKVKKATGVTLRWNGYFIPSLHFTRWEKETKKNEEDENEDKDDKKSKSSSYTQHLLIKFKKKLRH